MGELIEFYEFWGYMLGDGCITNRDGKNGRKKSASKIYMVLKDFVEIREKILLPLRVVSEGTENPKGVRQVYIGVDLTSKLGWSNGKTVPKFEDFTDNELACILRGLFESDGSVVLRKGKYLDVSFGNTDFGLIDFVVKGLERIGIKSTVIGWDREGNRKRMYEVYVLKEGHNLFREKVGFITERKKERLNWTIL